MRTCVDTRPRGAVRHANGASDIVACTTPASAQSVRRRMLQREIEDDQHYPKALPLLN